jgi:hypothetical protein
MGCKHNSKNPALLQATIINKAVADIKKIFNSNGGVMAH